jgi:serine/threonine protein phosphatase PrpC
MHLRVERLVRFAGDRIYYLVSNRTPRWYTKKCWECGNKHSPPNAQACTYCSAPLRPRRFLMAARWNPASSLEYQAFVHRRLRHKALSQPLALYRYKEQLLASFGWEGDTLLVGEPAPLPSRTVLSIAFQVADALSHLHAHGVMLQELRAGNILVRPDGTVRLFDLEIARLVDRSLPPTDDPTKPPLRDLRDLASVLERWVPVTDAALVQFLKEVRRGRFTTADELAAGISTFAWGRGTEPSPGQAAVLTDAGIVREANEDSWAWRTVHPEGTALYVVADGMGGHADGATASGLAVRTACRTLLRELPSDAPVDPATLPGKLRQAFEAANKAIRTTNADAGIDAGTTLVALLVHGSKAWVAHLGDSRAYLLRERQMKALTTDHSVVAARVEAGRLTEEEARNHADSNLLLHYLGHEDEADPDIDSLALLPSDRLLLCSDGLWGELEASRLGRLLGEHPEPRRAVRALVRAANDAGGRDNVTAMVIDIPPRS